MFERDIFCAPALHQQQLAAENRSPGSSDAALPRKGAILPRALLPRPADGGCRTKVAAAVDLLHKRRPAAQAAICRQRSYPAGGVYALPEARPSHAHARASTFCIGSRDDVRTRGASTAAWRSAGSVLRAEPIRTASTFRDRQLPRKSARTPGPPWSSEFAAIHCAVFPARRIAFHVHEGRHARPYGSPGSSAPATKVRQTVQR